MSHSEQVTTETARSAIKGFDKNLRCLDYQFTIGETFRHEGEVLACAGGFHVITDHPLAVFRYYGPAGNRFCRVTIDGKTHSDDQIKTAAEILTIGEEIGIAGLVQEAVDFVFSRAKPAKGEKATGSRGAASSTGYQGAASSTGYQGAASSTGYQGAASSTGDYGAASSTGYQGAASSTGYQGAASSTGDYGAASSTGYQGAASSTGYQGAALASGFAGKVMGADGNALFAVERVGDDGEGWPILSVAAGIVGKGKIKAGVWYVAKAGKLVEAS